LKTEQPSKPITVLYLIDTYLPMQRNCSTGGAERQLYLLASSLEPGRFRPIVAQLNPNGPSPGTDGGIGAGYALSLPLRRWYDLKGLWRILQLTRLAGYEKVDIIHTYFEKSEVIGWMTTLLARTPIWITSRRDLGFKRERVYDRIFRLARPSCTKCIAVCGAVSKQVTLNEGLSPNKVEVIYNGLDLAPYRQRIGAGTIRNQLGLDSATPLVGMVANFIFEIKGHRYFLEADFAGDAMGQFSSGR
jgi:glycosyltransferase involved in cell wall biosynthesis